MPVVGAIVGIVVAAVLWGLAIFVIAHIWDSEYLIVISVIGGMIAGGCGAMIGYNMAS